MKTAFKNSIVWWYQRVATKVGQDAYRERLKAFDYGNKSPDGSVTTFWLGPSAGGGLLISTDQQAGFLHRLYAGQLPVKPESLAYVEEIMTDETRGDVTMSGKTGTCASTQDGMRQVGWWVGRLKSPRADYVFAASIESPNDSSMPGQEVEHRVKVVFTQAGLWPPEP
jgi:beta-lactamase class D